MKDIWRKKWLADHKCKTVSCWCCGWFNKGKNKKLKNRRTRRRLKEDFRKIK